MDRFLAENKRLHWPTMDINDSEAVTTDNEVELPAGTSLS